ncbi:VOC family protein [Caballeronia sp. EK]|uniref:VOC family protein n=1 Tax=Caballeronia sp. EK TaxID=2767469 RepID=UPI0016550015|nr:VOC family protein [Caballeronia sp. EK]MBC8641361.1 VOC family protein [Caballeronia sp. EK]
MIIGNIFHIAIRASDLDTTVGFYRDALGLVEVSRPGGLAFSGAWMGLPPGGSAVLHVYSERAAAGVTGTIATDNDRGAVDHVAFHARGYSGYRDRLVRLGLSFREQHLSGSAVWQLFVHDPNGIKLELSFNEAEEAELLPAIEPGLTYSASERFFSPSEYSQFTHKPADLAIHHGSSADGISQIH